MTRMSQVQILAPLLRKALETGPSLFSSKPDRRSSPCCRSRTVADVWVGDNARVPAYTVNEDAVRHAKRLIDARQYVLRSRWQDVQPRAREQNAFLKAHSWEEYAAWHLGLTEGAAEESKARYAFVYGDFSSSAPDGADCLPLPCGGVAAQGDRARSTRAPAVPRPQKRLTTRRLLAVTASPRRPQARRR